jgi:hypothetical protein
MNLLTHPLPLIRASILIAMGLALGSPVQAQSAPPADGKMTMDGKAMEAHRVVTEPEQTMMQRRQAMMIEMKGEDIELAAQVAQMNGAQAEQKIDLMAAIITRMVQQRTAMNARMETMQGEMKMPMMPSDKEPMSSQPMMKGMDGNTTEAPKGQK